MQVLLCIVWLFVCSMDDCVSGSPEKIQSNTVGNREYYVYNGTKLLNFKEAWQRCDELGFHLATPDSDEVHNDIVGLISEINKNNEGPPYTSYYIGLWDYSGNNANFMWSNGDLLHFLKGTPMHWADGEPNNYNNRDEDCVTMGSSGKIANYDWFDVPCDVKRSYVCQRYVKQTPVDAGTYFLHASILIFISFVLLATAIRHRQKIIHPKLVPAAPFQEDKEDEEKQGANSL